MENISNSATTIARPSTTSRTFLTQGSASGFAMSQRGCTFAALTDAVRLDAGLRMTDHGTDLSIDPSVIVRERQVSAKGHVGFVAYIPGTHAWRPPLC